MREERKCRKGNVTCGSGSKSKPCGARYFYGDSLGRLEGMLQGDRAQLEDLAAQLPEGDAQARIRDMVRSYSKIEESLRRAARDVGAEDAVGEAARQAQEEAAGEPERAARGARDAAGTAAGRVTGPWGRLPAR
jgi:hypothetical protein